MTRSLPSSTIGPEDRIQLTNNFWTNEFMVSKDHPDLAAKLAAIPYEVYLMFLLAYTILQPVRDRFGAVILSSGLRSMMLNIAVGGVEDPPSQHLYTRGGAVDFDTPGAPLDEVWLWISESLPHAYSQLILGYIGSKDAPPVWIHAGLPHPAVSRLTKMKVY